MNPLVLRGRTAMWGTRRLLVLVPVAALGWVGCDIDVSPSASPGGQTAPATEDAAPVAEGDGDGAAGSDDDTQWSYVYDRYFAAGTAGHCGNSGCHARPHAGFTCGSTASSCFDGLVAARLVDLAHPSSSRLGDAARTPLAWFASGDQIGKMPVDEAVQNQDAVRAVTKWLAAGAKHDSGARAADAGTDPSGPDASVHDASAPDGSAPADASSRDAQADGAPPPPPAMTWTKLYTSYFGPGTPGHCGNSGCHSTTRAGFKCGATKTTCFSGLVAAGLVSTTNPSSSTLGNPQQSPLAWFGGPMPKDNAVANPAAAQAVTAWLTAGAHND